MKGIFIGAHGSMGFHKNTIYEFETYVDKEHGWIVLEEKNGLWCCYEKLETLLRNWDVSMNDWTVGVNGRNSGIHTSRAIFSLDKKKGRNEIGNPINKVREANNKEVLS